MAGCSGVNVDILHDNGDNELGACGDSAPHTLHCSSLAYGLRFPYLLNIC